jgi:hypothetical protein
MTAPRLATATLVPALSRLAEREGGFAVIVVRGDPVSGTVLLQMLEKGRFFGLFEPGPPIAGATGWHLAGPAEEDSLAPYLGRRKKVDPDLWIVELDVPDVQRFISALPGTS